MRRFSTLLALLAIAGPASAQTATRTAIETSTLSTAVYNNGALQGNCDTAQNPWFGFNGVELGCGSGFVVGLSATQVVGDMYNLTASTGWTPGSAGASTVFPFPTLTSGVRTSFASATAGLSVVSNHYYSEVNPDFIVHQYQITNTGTAARTGVRPGMMFDYDIGDSAANVGGYDGATQTIYTNAPGGPFAAITVLGGTTSGYRVELPYPPALPPGSPPGTPTNPHAAADKWNGLTTRIAIPAAPRDYRGIIGAGAFDIAPGATITVAFAAVAGTSLADLLANAAAARAATGVTTADEGGPNGTSALGAPRPNPSAGATALTMAVEQTQAVRVGLYDVLGREVSVLFDGVAASGQSVALTVASSALPAGVYVVRAEGATFRASQRLIVAR